MFINRAVTITSLAGGALATLLAFLYGNGLLGLIAAALFLLSIVFWRYGYILFPFFTKGARIIEIRGTYEIPPTRDYIIKKGQNGYYASKFMEIRYYESSLDKGDSEKRYMFESFEKAISSLKYVVKISLLVSAVDISAHIEELKTRRGAAEAKQGRSSKKDVDENARLDREIAMYTRQLERITSGERPVEIIAFASTTSFGLTKEEAAAKVRRQAKEVRTILSSSLSTDVIDLADNEMLRCFEWDKFFPTTAEEIKDEVF
ncbi:MAG: hypothetical protein WCT31_04470 [Candidatus Micrarchaeia archaeon]|jgi:hypothetical protein